MPELRSLSYFLAVAEERSFARAAERLHVAQPVVSRQVRELERELGVELLHRSVEDVAPTEAGRLLLERGPVVLSLADSLWRDVQQYADGRLGNISFGYGMSAGYETAPALLQAMSEECPGIEVSARVLASGDIVNGVAHGLLDVGLVRCAPEVEGLRNTLIRLERQGVILGSDHPLAKAAADTGSVDPADLDGVRLLLHTREQNPGHYDAVMGIAERAGAAPEVLVRGQDYDGAYQPVVEGSAVTIVGASGQVGLPGGLVWLPLDPPAAMEVHLITRADERSASVERMLEVARATAARDGWLTPVR
ncbi:LysR family transcriptional regulator [Phaeacidiphilus oryzae]|uniref:LysR family transcriptional regulator n=1 Tax=Phaeacidiphilus oryzae TaxID=348818 RepID=UPI0007C72942|nr:LysR family transcriptional regulator [Phaeacidiphilus oryzae]